MCCLKLRTERGQFGCGIKRIFRGWSRTSFRRKSWFWSSCGWKKIFSKKKLARFPESGEITKIILNWLSLNKLFSCQTLLEQYITQFLKKTSGLLSIWQSAAILCNLIARIKKAGRFFPVNLSFYFCSKNLRNRL